MISLKHRYVSTFDYANYVWTLPQCSLLHVYTCKELIISIFADFHLDSLSRHMDIDALSIESDLSFDQTSLQERSVSVQSSSSQLTTMDEVRLNYKLTTVILHSANT